MPKDAGDRVKDILDVLGVAIVTEHEKDKLLGIVNEIFDDGYEERVTTQGDADE